MAIVTKAGIIKIRTTVILLAVVMTKARGVEIIVRGLIRSRQLAHPFGLPVYVARRPSGPFCETPILDRRLIQTPYNAPSDGVGRLCYFKTSPSAGSIALPATCVDKPNRSQ